MTTTEKRKFSKKDLIIYIAFGLVMLVIFLYLTFPIEKLKGKICSEFQKSTDYDLTIDDIGTHFITGLVMKNAQISPSDNDKAVIELNKLNLWANPFSLIVGNLSLSVYSKLYDGEIDGGFKQNSTKYFIDLDLDKIKLDKIKYLKEAHQINILNGTLTGLLELTTDTANPANTNGQLKLDIPNLSLGDLEIPTPLGPFKVPPLNFNKIHGEINAKDGKVKIANFRLEGRELTVIIDGDMNLDKKWRASPLNINFRFNVTGVLEEKFGIIFQNFFRKENSGMYTGRLVGTLGSPSLTQ